MKIDSDFIRTENDRLYSEWHSKWKWKEGKVATFPFPEGHPYSPEAQNEKAIVAEIVRALCVLEKWQMEEGRAGGKAIVALRYYSIQPSVINHVLATYLPEMGVEELLTAEKPEKRKTRWATFEKWTKEHQGEQFTTDQLCEISGFSYPSTLNFVKSSPLFRRVKKGLYEVLTTPERE